MPAAIALIADHHQKDNLVSLAKKYRSVLSHYHLIATKQLGLRIQEQLELSIEYVASRANCGEAEILARIVADEIVGVIYLIDPTTTTFNEPHLQYLLQVCTVHNVPLAMNLASAELALQGLAKRRVAYLIFNPVAGRGNPDQDLALIRQILEPQVQLHTIFTQPDIDPVEQAKEAIAAIQGNDSDTGFIIASGGDGTVSAIAGATFGTNIPLGVIPRGTANAFSVALGIPTDLRPACEMIAAGNTRQVDAAYCNDIPMILLAGVGFEAEMVHKANRELKDRFGALAYVFSGAQQIFDQQPFEATIEIEDQVLEVETAGLTVANVAPPTSVTAQGFGEVIPDDGLLDVTISTSKSWFQGINTLASLASSALVKSPVDREDLICLRTQYLKITTPSSQKLVIDGEVIETDAVEFKCIPSGLTIFSTLSET